MSPLELIVRQLAADSPWEWNGKCRFCNGPHLGSEHIPLCVWRQAREWVDGQA